MAIKTQIRLEQVTGSFGDRPGGIVDNLPIAATLAAITPRSGSMVSVMSELASAIQRIHGGAAFSAGAQGVFATHIVPATDNTYDLGASGTEFRSIYLQGDVLMADAGTLKAAAGDLTIDSDAGSVIIQAAEEALDAIVLNAEHAAGGIDLSVAGTAKLSLDTNSLDITSGVIVNVDDTTASTSKTTGALVVDGGVGIALDLFVGDDLTLHSDDAVLNLGAGYDVNLTHDGGNGGTLAATGSMNITAGAASRFKATAGNLTIDSAATLILSGALVDIDADAGVLTLDGHGVNIGTQNATAAISIGNAVSETTVNDNLTVTGDLTVNGATVTIDTTNLSVKDPVITLNEGGHAPNADGGLLFTSGSSSATKPGVAFGRVANDTWGLGTIAIPSSGTMATVAGMTTSDMALRAGKFELDSSSDYIELDTNVKIVAAADIILDPAGNNVLPGGDSADSLGASGTAWANLYVDAIDLNGQGDISMGGTGRIDLDADDDTSIRASADDVITFEAGGTDRLDINATAIEPSTDDGITLGSANKNFSDLFLADSAVLNFGDDQDVSLTHVVDAGLLLTSSMQLQFNDDKVAIYKGGTDQMILKSNNIAFTMPSADGIGGAYLTTNGTGALSFNRIHQVKSGSAGAAVLAGADVASGAGLGVFALNPDASVVDAVLGDHLKVFVNGQLLFSGSEAERAAGTCDYVISGSAQSLKAGYEGPRRRIVLGFGLEADDVVQTIIS